MPSNWRYSADRKAFGIDGLLESAVLRPVNQWNYGQTDMAALAAAYAFGLARNHAFVDGNKRIAFHAMMVFLRSNDIPFAPDPAQPRPSSSPSPQARSARKA